MSDSSSSPSPSMVSTFGVNYYSYKPVLESTEENVSTPTSSRSNIRSRVNASRFPLDEGKADGLVDSTPLSGVSSFPFADKNDTRLFRADGTVYSPPPPVGIGSSINGVLTQAKHSTVSSLSKLQRLFKKRHEDMSRYQQEMSRSDTSVNAEITFNRIQPNILVRLLVGFYRKLFFTWSFIRWGLYTAPIKYTLIYIVVGVIIAFLSSPYLFYSKIVQYVYPPLPTPIIERLSEGQSFHASKLQSYTKRMESGSHFMCPADRYFEFRGYNKNEYKQRVPHVYATALETFLQKNMDTPCASTLDLPSKPNIYHITIRHTPKFGQHEYLHFINPEYTISDYDIHGNTVENRIEERTEYGTHCDGRNDITTGKPIGTLKRKVIRSNRIVVYYKDLNGDSHKMGLPNEAAQCIQHFTEVFHCRWPCINVDTKNFGDKIEPFRDEDHDRPRGSSDPSTRVAPSIAELIVKASKVPEVAVEIPPPPKKSKYFIQNE